MGFAGQIEPKGWRQGAGLQLAEVARQAGLKGKNPARTYQRYEHGEQDCPPQVIEKVRELSGGEVGAEAWQQVRIAFLNRRKRRRAA